MKLRSLVIGSAVTFSFVKVIAIEDRRIKKALNMEKSYIK